MDIKEVVKVAFNDFVADAMIVRKKNREIRAFRDPRRVAIANSFPLTNEQREEIDDLFVNNYGKKVGYVWHQNYAAHTGRFDKRFFPGLLYLSEFEQFENQNKSFVSVFNDKNFIPEVAKSVGVRTPRVIVSCTNGLLRDGDNKIIDQVHAEGLIREARRCFVKPTVNSSSGRGCDIINEDARVSFTRNTLVINGEDSTAGYKNDFVVQELVVCHDSIRAIYAGSCNTFRVITYLWKGTIEVMPVAIRFGRSGNFLDNAHQGGMFCAVYDDGSMGSLAVTEFNDQFSEHPDTHTIFANHRIDNVGKVVEVAKRMHAIVPQIGVVNWDFTIDADGEPVLIEANCKNGGIWCPQMAHGIGAFGDKTPEVLRWLRFMKGLKPHLRINYVGGYIE